MFYFFKHDIFTYFYQKCLFIFENNFKEYNWPILRIGIYEKMQLVVLEFQNWTLMFWLIPGLEVVRDLDLQSLNFGDSSEPRSLDGSIPKS